MCIFLRRADLTFIDAQANAVHIPEGRSPCVTNPFSQRSEWKRKTVHRVLLGLGFFCGLVQFTTSSAIVAPIVLPAYSYTTYGTGSNSFALNPTTSVSTSSDPGEVMFATLRYYFAVIGPSAASVPIDVFGRLSASETLVGSNVQYFYGNYPLYDDFAWINVGTTPYYKGNPGFVFAGIGARGTRSSGDEGIANGGQVGYSAIPVVQQAANGINYATATTTLDFVGHFLAQTNQIYTVELTANSSAGYNSPTLQNFASAFADPYLQIAQSFTQSNPGYSIIVSPGVGNSPLSAVPEPLTFELIGLGVIACLIARRRKRTEVRSGILSDHVRKSPVLHWRCVAL